MKIQYDKAADALYIYINKGKIKKTIKIKDCLIVDIGEAEKIIGVEILNASLQMPKKEISKIEMKIPAFSYA